MRQLPPEIGARFGRWTVTGEPTYSFIGNQARLAVPCRCVCGTERIVLAQSLRRSDRANPSCGCWKREVTAGLVARTRWSESHHRAARNPVTGKQESLYELWKRINRRCHDPKAHNYRWYGARGIKVCDEWRRDAGAFIAYVERELGPRPLGMSLDRISNDGDYAPGNLKWSTAAEQAQNRRTRS